MMDILLAIPLLYSSPQFCTELQSELSSATKEELIDKEAADAIYQRCIDVYTKGA